MAKEESIAIKDAIHKVQLSLLEGIQNENQLFSAGALMSRSDYQDVVTERSIANMCGYPPCSNSLPAERPRKSRYRVSLKEHKVYDLHETYMYCSINCVVNSGAFAGSLQEERCSVMNSAKLNEILRLFEGMSLDSKEDLGKKGDLGFSKLMIQEKTDTKVGEVSLEEWIGPSNAIEGYVPQRDRSSKALHSKNNKKGSKANHAKLNKQKNIFNEMDFTSAIITEDEYSISKMSSGPNVVVSDTKFKEPKGKVRHKNMEDQFTILETSSSSLGRDSEGKLKESEEEKSGIVRNDDLSIPESSLSSCQNGLKVNATEAREESHAEKAAHLGATILKPSLKHAAKKKPTRSVTWADDKTDSADSKNLCEVREFENTKYAAKRADSKNIQDDDISFRCASAEACAIALSQAAEAITSGESDVSDAVSEAGIIILPPPHDANEAESQENIDVVEPEPAPLKWPRKPGNTNYDLFDSEDSWYDSPPEGLNLTLSSFATMWMALFAWISSSSLAYIYGRDASFHEEYISINGREYPPKIVAIDGRSSEIKQTLAGCLARALPGLVAYLRLPTPISILEQGMGRLLETMSFIDPLPPFRMKQWQVIVLLFIDALSVSRIPALTPHMTNGRTLLYKVLNGAQISAEEYETMKDLILPLGRVVEFSTQKGG